MGQTAPTTIAVLGSCVTRDNFNSRFNPDYKESFECVALADKVSLVSLMAEPVEVAAEDFPELDARNQSLLVEEFSRSFLSRVEELEPQYLIIDLWADVMYGFAKFRNSYISRNFHTTIKTNIYQQQASAEFLIHRDMQAYLSVWKPAADRLFSFLDAKAANTKVVLHSARNTDKWVTSNGAIREFDPFYSRLNRNWQAMDDYILHRHRPRHISIFTPETKSFESHPWGPYHVHYTFDYHRRFLDSLKDLVCADKRADSANCGPRNTASRN